ncbi:MAG: hypothetical protein AB1486_07465 [Planctomycetota bacterium]
MNERGIPDEMVPLLIRRYLGPPDADSRCPDEEELAALEAGVVSARRRAVLERHLQSCPVCNRREDLARKFAVRVSPLRRARRWWPYVVTAAAAGLLLALVLVVLHSRESEVLVLAAAGKLEAAQAAWEEGRSPDPLLAAGPAFSVAWADRRGPPLDSEIVIEAPRRSILTGRPGLRWSVPAGASRVRVRLEDSNGQALLETWTEASSLDLGELESPLAAGDYLLRIEPARAGLSPAEVVFTVVDEGTRQRVDAELAAIEKRSLPSSATSFLKAHVLCRHDLVLDALAVLESLRESIPTSSYPHDAMAVLYQDLGLLERAGQAHRQAEALRQH